MNKKIIGWILLIPLFLSVLFALIMLFYAEPFVIGVMGVFLSTFVGCYFLSEHHIERSEK